MRRIDSLQDVIERRDKDRSTASRRYELEWLVPTWSMVTCDSPYTPARCAGQKRFEKAGIVCFFTFSCISVSRAWYFLSRSIGFALQMGRVTKFQIKIAPESRRQDINPPSRQPINIFATEIAQCDILHPTSPPQFCYSFSASPVLTILLTPAITLSPLASLFSTSSIINLGPSYPLARITLYHTATKIVRPPTITHE
jgi:hypothetical protein